MPGLNRSLVVRFLTSSLLWLLAVRPAAAEIKGEIFGGSAINFPSTLVIHQDGFPDLHVSGADYETRPFGNFPYYSWRIGYWRGQSGWELQHIHHRIFLTNPPPEIQSFAIHYGYNYFLFGYARKSHGFVYHVGAGPIVTNPETTVRGREFHSEPGLIDVNGNFFSGIGTQVAVGRELRIARHVFLSGEVGFTAGFAWRVPIADGTANVPNRALHGRVGVGFSF